MARTYTAGLGCISLPTASAAHHAEAAESVDHPNRSRPGPARHRHGRRRRVHHRPQHESFTAADSAWCREYMATTARLVEAGRTADAPRSIAASDLPATAWTPEEADTNRKLAEWSNRWDVERERLRNGVENPTLRLLLTGSLTASTELTTKIADGTYKPVDFALFRSVTATDNALSSICDRI